MRARIGVCQISTRCYFWRQRLRTVQHKSRCLDHVWSIRSGCLKKWHHVKTCHSNKGSGQDESTQCVSVTIGYPHNIGSMTVEQARPLAHILLPSSGRMRHLLRRLGCFFRSGKKEMRAEKEEKKKNRQSRLRLRRRRPEIVYPRSLAEEK